MCVICWSEARHRPGRCAVPKGAARPLLSPPWPSRPTLPFAAALLTVVTVPVPSPLRLMQAHTLPLNFHYTNSNILAYLYPSQASVPASIPIVISASIVAPDLYPTLPSTLPKLLPHPESQPTPLALPLLNTIEICDLLNPYPNYYPFH